VSTHTFATFTIALPKISRGRRYVVWILSAVVRFTWAACATDALALTGAQGGFLPSAALQALYLSIGERTTEIHAIQ